MQDFSVLVGSYLDLGVLSYLDPGVLSHLDREVLSYLDLGVLSYLDLGVLSNLDLGVLSNLDLGMLWGKQKGWDLLLPLGVLGGLRSPSCASSTLLIHSCKPLA